jgi:hypothetical protein
VYPINNNKKDNNNIIKNQEHPYGGARDMSPSGKC